MTVFRRIASTLLAGVAAAAMSAGTVSAQGTTADGGKPLGHQLGVLDTGGDNKVTMDEITGEHGRLFGGADVNGDGRLSVDEFRRRGAWFQRVGTTTLFDLLDSNGDQYVSPGEIDAPAARWFKRYDTNVDGALTADEVPTRGDRRGRR